MGNLICRKCSEHCYSCPGCGPPCANNQCTKLLVKSHLVCSDGSAPAAQHYPVAGEDAAPQHDVCRDFFVPESEPTNTTIDSIQFVVPLVSSTADMLNIGSRKSMSELENDCLFNSSKVQKIRDLAQRYTHWRPIRGDGNCYYRTVIFGTLEMLIGAANFKRVEQLVNIFREMHFDENDEQQAHEGMLNHLCSCSSAKQLEQCIAIDEVMDQAIIRACRRLVRIFLIQNADTSSPNGLTYLELAQALDATYQTIEDFCKDIVDPMGRDAETLALDALPQQLGVGLRMWILDRRDDVDLINLDTPGPDGSLDVHVLYKPGHYDLLYPKLA